LDATDNCFRDSEFSWIDRLHRRFMKEFSKIAKLMMKLLEKNKTFEWTAECQANFEELRKFLTTALVFVLQDLTKKFGIYFDASHQ
jgi:hypothetical protein